MPYKPEWHSPNKVARLGPFSSIEFGSYAFVPAGPAEPETLLQLLNDYLPKVEPASAEKYLQQLRATLQEQLSEVTDDHQMFGGPETIDQCLSELQKVLTGEQLEQIRAIEYKDLISLHFSVGQWIRNHWVHDRSPILSRASAAGGSVFDGDAFSGLILDVLWHQLRGLEYPVAESHHLREIAGYTSTPETVWAALIRSRGD